MNERAEEPGVPATAPRVSFWTLGCRLNQHDTAALRALALEAGASEVRAGRPGADVHVVNTCTVTARADQEARQLVRRLHRGDPGARIVVTGCYAQRAPEEIRSLPGVTAVLGAAERDDAPALHRALAGGPEPRGGFVRVGDGRAARRFATPAPVHVGRSRAILKVQDGCDSFCAYCIVPYVRGRHRSLPLCDALDRARRILETGFSEIVLTGADLGSYGRESGDRHAVVRLVEGILSLGSRHRVRLSSIEPNKLDPALADLVGREPRLCRHVHLPLQSGSNAVLRAMRRGYTREGYRALVSRIAARTTVGIGTDVIVGFPGEGEAEFDETLRLLEEAPVTFLHVFRYSARPGTAASRIGRPEPDWVLRDRSETLRALGDAKAEAFRRSFLGASLPVVLESGRGEHGPIAMSDVYLPVELDRVPERNGIHEALIEGMAGRRLQGTIKRAPRYSHAILEAIPATG